MSSMDAAKAHIARLSPAEKGPGFQYCLVESERISCHAEGIADLRTGAPVTRRTTFNAFSVTKPFTSAALMRLADQGRMDLAEPIGRYVDSLPYRPEPDIRQILSHLGGLPNPFPLNWVHPAQEHGGFDERKFIRGLIAAFPALRRDPGQAFAYSNLGYLLLQLAIEQVTGERFPAHVEGSLIARLDLEPDDYLGFSIPGEGRHALGNVRRWSLPGLFLPFLPAMKRLRDTTQGDWIQLKAFQVDGAAYGGLIANASGLARFLQALMAPGLLSEASLTRMLALQQDREGREKFALGWFGGRLGGRPYLAHSGGGGGYYCEIRLYPGMKRASVFMSNRTGMTDERILDRIDPIAGR